MVVTGIFFIILVNYISSTLMIAPACIWSQFSFAERMQPMAGGEVSREANLTGKGQPSRLALLIMLHNMTGAFAKNVQHLLASIDLAELAKVLQAVYHPYESYKQRYVIISNLPFKNSCW